MAKWLKSQEFLTFEVKEKIAYITLNRPDKRNALSPGLIGELHDAMVEADDLTSVHVIVLQGAGKDFCAGYDLGFGSDPKNQQDDTGSYRSRMGTFDDDVFTMTHKIGLNWIIADVHKPVIAKVHGRAVAGGADIALMCDLVIAADDSRFSHPGSRSMGAPPINYWMYHCGPQWAKRLLLTGDNILGKDAARIGLALDSVPADELDSYVHSLARRIAMADPEVAAANKRAVNLQLELAGSRVFQRLAIEADARGHLSKGPGRAKWKSDVAEHGVRRAIRLRDDEYGYDPIRIRHLDDRSTT